MITTFTTQTDLQNALAINSIALNIFTLSYSTQRRDSEHVHMYVCTYLHTYNREINI